MIIISKISGWYFLGLLIWVSIVLLRKLNIFIPFINNHLTDLYTIPMYCYTLQILMNRLFGYQWKPDLKFMLQSAAYISIIFEVLGPYFSSKFTGDIVDILCYFAGAFIFHLIIKYRVYQFVLKKFSKSLS